MLRTVLRDSVVALILATSLASAVSSAVSWAASRAASPAEQRGRAFALNNCARCHAIDLKSPSPLKAAPPFRTLHTKYPVENLAEALAEGIVTGHPAMPQFVLDPRQINDLLTFLKSLE